MAAAAHPAPSYLPAHDTIPVIPAISDALKDGAVAARQVIAATDEVRRRDLAAQIQHRAFEFVPYIPTGQLVGRRAFRKNLAGVLDAPLPFLWNIEKRS
jgi:hypothetical protein